MHKELIIEAIEKARKELESKGVHSPSNHKVEIFISDYILEEVGFSISKKSIANYHKAAIKNPTTDDINISQNNVVVGLCKYLGYDTYGEYILNTKSLYKKANNIGLNSNIEKSDTKNYKKSNRLLALIISMVVLLIIGVVTFYKINKERWMIWSVDHYEEVDFNKEKLSNGALKLFKEEGIDNFKKINNPDCNYKFFNEDGSVNVWYGKNKNGELEIFTDIGLHPETGKSLKPITTYMIRKYICDSL